MSHGFVTATSHSLLNHFPGFRAFRGQALCGGRCLLARRPGHGRDKHPRINAGKQQDRAVDPHRTSPPCSDRVRQLLKRGTASQVLLRSPMGVLKVLRRHKCKSIWVLCFLLGAEAPKYRKRRVTIGQAGAGRTPPGRRVFVLLCVFSEQARQGSKGQGARLCR